MKVHGAAPERRPAQAARAAAAACLDACEQEADRAATQALAPGPAAGHRVRLLQRPALARFAPLLPSAEPLAPSRVGQPLPGGLRSFMETRFGHDFARVRVHADSAAAASARAIEARAYTLGQHIVFGAGQYAPHDAAGRELIAHELAHVVQQHGVPAPGPQRKGLGGALRGFFSSFAHMAIDYSVKKIRQYLELLERSGDIEGDPDSDDKARQIVRDRQHLALSLPMRTLLVREMLDGWTLGGDERAIIDILRSASLADRQAMVAAVGRDKLWRKFRGERRSTVEALTLTAGDLKDAALMARLGRLSESKLVVYRKHVADPQVASAIDRMLSAKRHELSSYPEAARSKVAIDDAFDASAEGVIASDLEAARLKQSQGPAVKQTTVSGGSTRREERVDVPDIDIDDGIRFEYETRIAKAQRPGLERVARHMISEDNLESNITRNLAIRDYGKVYRFTRFEHAGGAGQRELVLIEEVGAIVPGAAAQPAADWDVRQPRAGAIGPGVSKVRAFEIQRGEGWLQGEWQLVTEALSTFPDSVVRELAGVTFRRRPCEPKFMTDGVCAPHRVKEEGGRRSNDGGVVTIDLFNVAFASSPSRYGLATKLAHTLAHEVGHQTDQRPLEAAVQTHDRDLAKAQADLDAVLAQPVAPAKGRKAIDKARADKQKADDAAWDRYRAERDALSAALDGSRSLSGMGWEMVGNERRLTTGPVNTPTGAPVEFLKAAAADGLMLTGTTATAGSISEYGAESVLEQYAELFALYLVDPALLQAIRPNVHRYLAARFPR
jgi:Domain of unknown function (DUF4157)